MSWFWPGPGGCSPPPPNIKIVFWWKKILGILFQTLSWSKIFVVSTITVVHFINLWTKLKTNYLETPEISATLRVSLYFNNFKRKKNGSRWRRKRLIVFQSKSGEKSWSCKRFQVRSTKNLSMIWNVIDYWKWNSSPFSSLCFIPRWSLANGFLRRCIRSFLLSLARNCSESTRKEGEYCRDAS